MLAKAGKRVVLVSADLRQPRLHELFGLPNRHGLSDILRGRRTLEECMLPTDFPNLIVCPSGPVAPNPAELLQSDDMSTFIDVLRKAADFVVIDCPPVLVVADTLGLVPMADGVILVADSTTTQRRAIVEARSHLAQVGTRVFGGVLNKVAAPGPGGYGYGYGPVSGGES
jgi:capsular exopolysaccharide synthesis family protein